MVEPHGPAGASPLPDGHGAGGFWRALEELMAGAAVVIDRPRGSCHPRHPDLVYPLDYGHLTGTSGGDGHEVDVWRGSRPEGRLDAVLCTVDQEKRDVEIKLLLGCTEREERTICDFHAGTHTGIMLLRRVDLWEERPPVA